MSKVYLNQIKEGTTWQGYTHKNHLIGSGVFDPVQVVQKLEQITQVDLQDDFIASVMRHGIEYIEADKDLCRWYIESAAVKNYELLGCWTDQAMTSAVTSGTNYCINGTPVFMLFENKPFSVTEHIVGMQPDLYTLRIADEPLNVGGNRFLCRVQLVNGSRALTGIPGDQILAGTRWSGDGGSIPDDRSDRGFDIGFKTNGMLQVGLGRFRMQHTLSSNTKDIRPLEFTVAGKDGKLFKSWLYNIEYEFYRKARLATAQLLMFGQTTVKSDGQAVLIDRNGEAITTGMGFKPQWAPSGLYTWGQQPDLDELTEIALSVSVGKVPFNQRRYFIKGGEWGLMELSKMVQRQLGTGAFQAFPYLGDTTGRAYKWNVGSDENGLSVKLGQFMGVATINGIQFTFVIDPSKDDPSRNKMYHPKGGLVSSYEFDIFMKDSTELMKIVRRKGQNPEFKVVDGIRGYFPGGSGFMSATQASSAVEGSVIHYIEPGIGAKVSDPSKIVRYYPTLSVS
jgi:hypothetical protein